MKKIIIDAMGGDRPEEIVKGGLTAAKENSDIRIVIIGEKTLIESVLNSEKTPEGLVDVIFTDEVISNEESPTMAVKTKKNSSMVKGFYMLKGDDDCMGIISTGSTGAVLTSATLILGRQKGIFRPSMVTFMPTLSGGMVAVSDCGANVDSHPEYLEQYGIMASLAYSALYNTASPRVALLNVGTEDKKGNTLTHGAFELLKNSDINFVGNMEARDACSGKYDVIVADGFDGNVLIKSIEGTASMFSKLLKQHIMESTSAKIGYLFMKKAMKSLKNQMDFNNYGGAVFLGVNKLVIKAHGSSKAASIYNSVKQIRRMYDGKVIDAIAAGAAHSNK